MRTDKFTQLLERMYDTYVRYTKRYGMETMSKKVFMNKMRRMEW